MTDDPKTPKLGKGRPLAVPTSRLARLGRLGGMTAGVAGNMALGGMTELGRGKRPVARDLLLTPRNITRVTEQLAQMRGAAMKVGQLVSMDTGDVLPPELSAIMGRLRADAHFMPPGQLRQVLNEAWPKGWLQHFAQFDVHPIAAASIGQVHRAQLKDGRDLAVKVQYPGVARSIDSDVANVGTLIKLSGLLPKGFDLKPYLEEARRQLHEETDYALEARQLAAFGALLNGDNRFVVPRYHEDWSTGTVLAMDHVEGIAIEDCATLAQADRDRIARDLFDLMLAELFTFGLMQTDPNFANYRYDPQTGRIVLLDFGATRALSQAIISQLGRLAAAGFAGQAERLEEIAVEIGFFETDTPAAHKARIIRMMAMVFNALGAAPEFDFASTDLPQRVQAEGIALSEDGFLPPLLPMDILYLQRKFGGMFLLAARLSARVPVTALLNVHMPNMDTAP